MMVTGRGDGDGKKGSKEMTNRGRERIPNISKVGHSLEILFKEWRVKFLNYPDIPEELNLLPAISKLSLQK